MQDLGVCEGYSVTAAQPSRCSQHVLESLLFSRFNVCIPQNKQIVQACVRTSVHKILTFEFAEAEEGFVLR